MTLEEAIEIFKNGKKVYTSDSPLQWKIESIELNLSRDGIIAIANLQNDDYYPYKTRNCVECLYTTKEEYCRNEIARHEKEIEHLKNQLS